MTRAEQARYEKIHGRRYNPEQNEDHLRELAGDLWDELAAIAKRDRYDPVVSAQKALGLKPEDFEE